MMTLDELTQAMHDFVGGKGWYAADSVKPQTPRNIALSLAIEAAEVLEHFQWSEDPQNPEGLSGELADVALYLLQLASIAGIDLEQAILDKLALNAARTWPAPALGGQEKRDADTGSGEGPAGQSEQDPTEHPGNTRDARRPE